MRKPEETQQQKSINARSASRIPNCIEIVFFFLWNISKTTVFSRLYFLRFPNRFTNVIFIYFLESDFWNAHCDTKSYFSAFVFFAFAHFGTKRAKNRFPFGKCPVWRLFVTFLCYTFL